jgi:IscR-regulated protein YhgI
MPYDPNLVQPMREELTRLGVQELRTAEEVDEVLGRREGATMVVVNSVCGCAAAKARPAVSLALEHALRPDRVVTVFAGQDIEATARAREYFVGINHSSPSIALQWEGELVFMLERHQIEGREAEEIAGDLTAAFDEFFSGERKPVEQGSEVSKEDEVLSKEDEVLMVQFTPGAAKQIRGFLAEDDSDDLAVRISIPNPSPLAPEYEMSLIDGTERQPDDTTIQTDGFEVVVDCESAKILNGTTIDWVETLAGSGFKFDNPNIKPLGSEPLTGPLAERVQQVIDERINPGVATHGGTINLVDVRDNVVYLRMGGGCQGCGMASVTLTQGIKEALREAVPEIVDIQDVTDHAAGADPYFSSAK